MANVKIYSTTTCPYCKAEKEYLQSKGVDFEEVNLDQDPDQINTFLDTCGSMAVPCTHITQEGGHEEIIVGFDKAALDKTLKL